jgi:hypothetical protein
MKSDIFTPICNMKLRPIAELNALGFENNFQRVLYAATQLVGGTNPSTAKTITAAVPAANGNPAIPAVTAPAVAPNPKFTGSCTITDTANTKKILARLPYSAAALAKGANLSVALLDEASPTTLDLGAWIGAKASNIPTVEMVAGIKTVEQYLYKSAVDAIVDLGAAATADDYVALKLYNGMPVVEISLNLPKLAGADSYLGSVGDSGGSNQFGA